MRMSTTNGDVEWLFSADGTKSGSFDVARDLSAARDGSADVFAAGVVQNTDSDDVVAVRVTSVDGARLAASVPAGSLHRREARRPPRRGTLAVSSRLLRRVLTLIDELERRKRRPLPGACASALRAIVQDARTRVEARLATPGT
jgi:hypothetical protein